MSQFKENVVIVTGAGTGIGRAIARGFVKQGARVAFVGRRTQKLGEAAAGLARPQVLCCGCDVSDRSAVNATVQRVVAQFGAVDTLVNNAGINTNPRSVADVDPADWDRTVAINLTGAFNCVRAVLPGMQQRKGGLIINVSSIAGVRASKVAGAAYCASKHGMMALNDSINHEEKNSGIRACAICPGEVETPILDQRPEPVGPEHRARIIQPEDIAATVLFVAGLPPRVHVPELIIKPTSQSF